MMSSRQPNFNSFVTKGDFHLAFAEFVPFEHISSGEIAQRAISINKQLISKKTEWEVKEKLLMDLCSMLIAADGNGPESLMKVSRQWEECFINGPNENRSSLCKAYCVAIAFFAFHLGNNFFPVVERLLPNLIKLTQKHISVLSSSGSVACQFIFQYVQVPKLIDMLPEYSKSRASEIRATTVSLAMMIAKTWPSDLIHRKIRELYDALEHCKFDADEGVRSNTSKLLQLIDEKYPDDAKKRTIALYGTPSRMPARMIKLPRMSLLVTPQSSPRLKPVANASGLRPKPNLSGSLQQLSTLPSKDQSLAPPITNRRRTIFEKSRAKSQIPLPPRRSNSVLRKRSIENTLSATKSPVSLFSPPPISTKETELEKLNAKVTNLESTVAKMEKKLEDLFNKNTDLHQIVADQTARIALLVALGTEPSRRSEYRQ